MGDRQKHIASERYWSFGSVIISTLSQPLASDSNPGDQDCGVHSRMVNSRAAVVRIRKQDKDGTEKYFLY